VLAEHGGRPGVAARMFATLSAAEINDDFTSEVKVSCID